MGKGFEIHDDVLDEMVGEIQQKLASRPVEVPVTVETPSISGLPAASTVNNYYGPYVVAHGDNAQIATGDGPVNQVQEGAIAPGFTEAATVAADLLANASAFGLDQAQQDVLSDNAQDILTEVVTTAPDAARVRSCFTMITGLLAPLILGASNGITQEAGAATQHAIETITHVVTALS